MSQQGNPSPVPPNGAPYPPPQGPPPGQYPHQQYPGPSPSPGGAPGYPPPQGPPQGQHGPPPQQGQYPPQQQWPQYPPQGQYGAPPPQNQYPPQPYQYPQGQYQYPPPGQFALQQPQHQPPYPPQQSPYGYPPQQQPPPGFGYGAPPPQQGYYPPQPQGYGAPAGYEPPSQPSLGYVVGLMSQMDATKDVDALRKAMKGLGTDEATLIKILCKADPLYVESLKHTFRQRLGRNLEKDVKSEVSGKLEKVLLACLRGPLLQDVYAVRTAVKGLGTNEDLLNDVLCGRSNADLRVIKQIYRHEHNRSLDEDVADDLSGRTKQLFAMITAANRAEESAPIDPQAVDRDVHELYTSLLKPADADLLNVCRVFSSRSNAQLRAIEQAYTRRHDPPLAKKLSASTMGHMKDALLAILGGATDPVKRDAELLGRALGPVKVNDDLLIERVVRLHWNKQHMQAVKVEFKKLMKKDLVQAVGEATSGDYKKAMLAVLEG